MVKLDEVQYDVGPTQHYARGDHAGIWARTRRQGRCFPEKSVSVSVAPWCCSGGESWGQCGSATPGSPRPNPRRGVFLGGHPRFAFAEVLWTRHFIRRDFGGQVAESRLRKILFFCHGSSGCLSRYPVRKDGRVGAVGALVVIISGSGEADLFLLCGAPGEQSANCD